MSTVYTTYLARMKKIYLDIPGFFIARHLPPYGLGNSPLLHTPSLAPSGDLLQAYKADLDWNKYVARFTLEMLRRSDMKEAMKQVGLLLKGGSDVLLVCYEKDYTKCHRSLIARHFQYCGFQWKELEF